MPCLTQPNLTETQKMGQRRAIDRLREAIGLGAVQVIIGRNGGISFKGWKDTGGVSDLCAYRVLANSPELRRAIARAEVMSGNKLDARAVAAGVHSHDGGATWGTH